jgi:TolB-like protein
MEKRELARVLESATFRRSVQLARLLRFIVEQALAGTDGASKETLIAIAIFGRRADYDPSCDPVVRVEARRLRRKLAEYYAHEGRANPLRIDLPKGGYAPRFIKQDMEGDAPARAMAVLPFADRSPKRTLDALADGLTARLIAKLGSREGDREGWRMVSAMSTFRFKNRDEDPRKIGEELHADCVLEGSLRRSGGRMRCDAQLVSCSDGLHLWAGSFETLERDVFAAEDEFAERISDEIRASIERR